MMNPKYPIYIISKSRWDSRLTAKSLEEMNQHYNIVVEESQYDNYASVISSDKILILPQHYLDNYDTCDDIGNDKSKGPGAARNYCWDHSIKNGHSWHWVMDDNIAKFTRVNKNFEYKTTSPAIFTAMEDFVDRYENIAQAGPKYDFFLFTKNKIPPFVLNTRIYSVQLIRNDIPYRWRGRYNEDTDLSLRALKDGWCTVEFNAFAQHKATTQTIRGGNSEAFYDHEGTLPKSKMLEELHPDVAKVVWKFNRWHHNVDYRAFKGNKLKMKEGLNIPDRVNNYGMKLIKKDELAKER